MIALAGAVSRVDPSGPRNQRSAAKLASTNGLLTIGGQECGLLSSLGMDSARISLSGHLVDDTGTGATAASGMSTTASHEMSTLTSTSSTTSLQAERQAQLQKRRAKKRKQRGRRTDQKQTQKGHRHTRRQTRSETREEQDRLASLK